MSNLSKLEKLKLERILGMKSGYVLNFSDRTFDDFFLENTGIDIYEDDKYIDEGTSKANRLRSFWRQESNHVVGKLIHALLEYWKWNKETDGSLIYISPSEQTLFNECFQISQRLMQDGEIDVGLPAIDAHFEEIQQTIIKQIELARFTIWIAVAWFTDREIFKKLVVKKNQGVNVQLIIVDDEINGNSGLKYEVEFETDKVAKVGKHENIMHNKFCVIDLNKVIHGSYNWTNKARFNRESITVIENNRKTVEEFAEQFIQLKKSVISS